MDKYCFGIILFLLLLCMVLFSGIYFTEQKDKIIEDYKKSINVK